MSFLNEEESNTFYNQGHEVEAEKILYEQTLLK